MGPMPHRATPGERRSPVSLLVCVVPLACLLLYALGCTEPGSEDAGRDLRGAWRFHPGELTEGGAVVSSPGYDASAWERAEVPGAFSRDDEEVGGAQVGWWRKVVAPDAANRRGPSGLLVGKVNSAYEVWAGGLRLGGVGKIPEGESGGRIDYDRHAVYHVPEEAVSADGRVVVALRVWTDPQFGALGGPHAGPFRFGDYGELVRRESRSEIPKLFFAGLFFLLGLFHLELYRRRSEQQGYLWFACVAILFSAYSVLLTQWKYALLPDVPFPVLKEVEHVVVFVLLACFVELVWNLLDLSVGLGTRAVQAASLAFAVVVVVMPGMGINQTLLLVFQGLMVWQVLLGTYLVLRELRRKSPAARTIFVGAVVGSSFFIHDILVDRGILQDTRITTYGFAVFVLFLAATLGEQFARRLREAEAARRREEEMRRAEEVARRSNEAKTEFLANVSHEIRTPMTAILGGLELLRSRDLGDEMRSRLKVIHRSGRDLLRVIDEILDFSKVEAGRVELSESDFDPGKSLRALVELYAPEARARGLELRLEGVDDLPRTLHGDAGRWRQVLLNVLSNALKFTPEGEVVVRVTGRPVAASGESAAFEVVVEVEDTGIGIESEHLEDLYQPFTQADASTSRRYGGTGLGLAISQRLVRLMGGRIDVESRVGVGSRFTVRVPFLVSADDAPASGEFSVFVPAAAGDGDGARRVLLAEDNEVNQMVVRGHLEALGYEVLLAHDGLEVLDTLDRERVDGVLMDCQMPRLDGYEATRRIRSRQSPDRGLPVIALTAHAFEGERERCLEAGMDDYLSKPFRSAELRAVLERWLGPA